MMLKIILFLISFNVFAFDQQLDLEHITIDGDKNIANTIYENTYYYDNNDGLFALNFIAQKSNNTNYNYIDLKEFYYNHQNEHYELKVGFDTVFWGVAESYNPVDIINQKNNLSSENKAKLSEAMLKFNYFFADDNIEALYLPYFREQKWTNFDINNTTFEDKKPAFALRYKGIIDNIDYGISYFNGIDRESNITNIDNKGFSSYYQNLKQKGVDIQLTTEAMLWKLEYAHKKYTGDSSDVFVAGLEYLLGSEIETNILLEILKHSDAYNIFADDIMLGLRLNLNNEESSEGLFSVIYDRKYHSKLLYINFNQRIFSDYKLDISANYGFNKHSDINIKSLQNQFGVKVSYYF